MRYLRYLIILAATLMAFHGSAAEKSLFPDPIVAKGKNIEVRRSKVDDAYVSLKASRAIAGQPIPPGLDRKMESQILSQLIATQLLLARATPEDKALGKETAEKFIKENKTKAGSEESYKRQLVATGTNPDDYQTQVTEQATVKAVIDRELKSQAKASEEAIKAFYEKNPTLFQEPEQVKVAHILITGRELGSGKPFSDLELAAKRAQANKILARAKGGEDFTKLVKEFTEDIESKDKNGEYTFARGGRIPKEFEAAAFSMKPGQISDIVQTVFGYHIIKLLEVIPGKKQELGEAREKIAQAIKQDETQKELPAFIEKLKKEAGVVVTLETE